MTGPVIGDPDSATLPRLLTDSETAELVALWNDAVVGRATADLHKADLEAAGNRTPGVAHVLIRDAKGCGGASLVLTLVSDGEWLARPPLDFDRMKKLLDHCGTRIERVADNLAERKRLWSIDNRLLEIARLLFVEMDIVDAADPAGVFSSWLPVTPKDVPAMWAFAAMHCPLPATGGR